MRLPSRSNRNSIPESTCSRNRPVTVASRALTPLLPGLLPVPKAPQEGICEICHSGCAPEYTRCYPCMQACQAFGDLSLLPISMSVNAKLLHRHLRGYKDDSRTSVKNRMSFRLAALLLTFMNNHARCLGSYDTIALVPSAKRIAMEGIIEYVALSARSTYPPSSHRAPGPNAISTPTDSRWPAASLGNAFSCSTTRSPVGLHCSARWPRCGAPEPTSSGPSSLADTSNRHGNRRRTCSPGSMIESGTSIDVHDAMERSVTLDS